MWKARLRYYTSFRKPWVWLLMALCLWGILIGILAPWLIKHKLQETAQQRLGLTLNIEKFRINPYLFSLTIDNLQLSDNNQRPQAGFSKLHINFESMSLFRWAWSFKQAHLLGVYSKLERYDTEDNNVQRLINHWVRTATPNEALSNNRASNTPKNEEGSKLPRFFIHDIQLQIQQLDILDQVPLSNFQTQLGPISLSIAELSTLPDRVGQQSVHIVTENGANLQWTGELSLSPLHSNGSVTLSGPLLSIAAEYFKDTLNFKVEGGDLKTQLNYVLQQINGELSLSLSDINNSLAELSLINKSDASPLFTMEELLVHNGELHWPQNSVNIELIDFRNAELWLSRNSQGNINLAELFNLDAPSTNTQPTETELHKPTSTTATVKHANPSQSQNKPWLFNNTDLKLSNWQLHFSDETLIEPGTLNAKAFNLHLSHLTNETYKPLNINMHTELAKGALAVSGTLNPHPVSDIKIDVTVKNFNLPQLQPWLAPHAKVNVASGLYSMQAHIQSTENNSVQIGSDLQVEQLSITENATQQPILAWQALHINDINLDEKAINVSVGNINLNKAYIDFAIAQDGTNSIDRILIPAPNKPISTTPNTNEAKNSTRTAFSVASIQLQEASGKFSDASLPLPFSTEFAELSGGITTIDSNSLEPADIEMEGRVNEYGLMKINGALTPFAIQKKTQLSILFKNVDIPKFSPYAIKFAGRNIDKGRLNLSLGYRIEEGALLGENDIEFQQLTLGKRVDQPGALDLPLDLAIALLKDSKGNIQLDLPVSGNVGDPKFSYTSVIGQALTRLITNIVASPFRLLGSLVGGDGDTLKNIQFDPGSAKLTPPEKEKLLQLTEALSQRPSLKLQLNGVYTPSLDLLALKTQQFTLEEISEFGKEKAATLSRTSREYINYIERRYKDAGITPLLPQVKQETTYATDANAKAQLDKLAYITILRSRLIEQSTISEEALHTLALARASNIQTFLINSGLNISRAIVNNSVVTTKENAKLVNMPLKLGSD